MSATASLDRNRAGSGAIPSPTLTTRLLNLTSRLPRIQRAGIRAHARLYRRTRGRVLGRWLGAPVILIEAVGRRTGRRRVVPVIHARDGARFVVTAANAGAKRMPAWWLNLRAAGTATILFGGERIPVQVRLAGGAERERLWGLLRDVLPAIDEYRGLTERQFPVIVLEPTDG